MIADEKQAAERAKRTGEIACKTSVTLASLTALLMLIRAILVSVLAAYGGRLRDAP